MFLQRFFILLTLFFSSWSIGLAQTGQITGIIIDQNSGEPLPGANLILQGTNYGVGADQRGHYILDNIPAGEYTIKASRIGYVTETKAIQLSDSNLRLDIELTASYVKFGEVIVTATRENELRSEVTAATEIITSKQIEKSGAQNLGEILQNATGIFMKDYGDIGALKTVTLRGASENQVLILLDGQRLNQSQGTAPDLSDIPLHAIERIEIVRGGHSALYGTDAVGGVINLITHNKRLQDSFSGKLISTVGSFGTKSVEGNFNQQIGNLNYFITHKYTESDGDFEFKNEDDGSAKRANNTLKYNDTFLNFNYFMASSGKLSGFVQFHDAKRGVPGPLNFSSDGAIQKDKSWKYNLKFERQFSPHLNFRAATFYYNFKQNFDDPNPFFPIISEHKNDVLGFNTQSNWHWSNANKLTWGYEYRQDKINSTDVEKQKRINHGLFAQNKITIPFGKGKTVQQVSLIPAIRLDDYSDSDAQVSPKIGFIYNYVNTLNFALRGNWGRSYRLPSFNDLYWPAGAFTAGNPDLKPEKGSGYDLGASVALKRLGFWEFDVTYFNTSLNNMIVWGPNANSVWQPQNIQKANLNGLESSLTFRGLNDVLNFKINHNYLNTSNESDNDLVNGKNLIYRPNHTLAFNIAIDLDVINFNINQHYTGKRFTNEDNSSSLKSYSKIDVWVARKQLIGQVHLRASLGVKNIFDKQVQVIENYPTPGREYRVALGFEL